MSEGTALDAEPFAAELASRSVYDSAHRPPAFFDEILELYRYRDLVRLWSARNVTLRYKRSFLGVLWTLLEPLLMMLVLSVVFSTIFRFTLPNYAIYVLCGLTAFDFFSRSSMQMVEEIIASQNLAQRIHLPRSALAVASILSYLVSWSLAVVPLLGIMVVLDHPFSWNLLLIPVAMALFALFALGIGLTVATVGAFFHDFKLTYAILLNILFYATPIIYPVDIVPENLAAFFKFNPMYYLVRLFRDPIYAAQSPPGEVWLYGTLASLAAAAFGWWMFTHLRSAFEYRV